MQLPKPKKKTSERKKLVARLDRVFSQYIRKRDERCVCCGASENLQCGHLFSRNSYSTRWNERNAFCQCAGCNYKHEFDAYPLTNYFLSIFDKDEYDALHTLYKTQVKYGNEVLEDLIAFYKDRLNESDL